MKSFFFKQKRNKMMMLGGWLAISILNWKLSFGRKKGRER
jgi:hypothetical protein